MVKNVSEICIPLSFRRFVASATKCYHLLSNATKCYDSLGSTHERRIIKSLSLGDW